MAVWAYQPTFPAPINPLWANGLQLCAVPAVYGRYLSALPQALAPVSPDFSPLAKQYKPSIVGPVFSMTNPAVNPTAIYYATDLRVFDNSSTYTIMFVGAGVSSANRFGATSLGDASSGFQRAGIDFNCDKTTGPSTGKVCFYEYNGGVNVAAESAATETDGKIAVFFGRRNGSDPSIWKNGKNITASTTTGSSTTSSYTDRWSFGHVVGMAQDTILAVIWNLALSDAAIVQLSRNPWQIFDQADDEVYFGVSGAAGTLLKANYTSLTDLSALNTTAKAGISAANGLTTGS